VKTILHPTDFSDNSLNALNYALEFCKKSGSKLIVLHAYGSPIDLANRTEDEKSVREKANESMEWLNSEYIEGSGVKCETMIAGGSPVQSILEIAGEHETDLIVMGTKGNSDFDNIIFGSSTVEVILDSNSPVMAVPEGVSFSEIRNVTYAADYREEDFPIIWDLIQIATYLEADLHILNFANQKSLVEELMFRGFRDLINEKFQYEDIHVKVIYGDDLTESLHGYTDNLEGALLAMGYYRTNFLNSLSKRESVKEMALHTHTPLLVVPERSDES
jgi:nucleotide-binding universal stress UspA family protein